MDTLHSYPKWVFLLGDDRSSGPRHGVDPRSLFTPPPLLPCRRKGSYAQAASPPSPTQHVDLLIATDASPPGPRRPSAGRGPPGMARSTRLVLGDVGDQTTFWTKTTMTHTSTISPMGHPYRRGERRSPRSRCCPRHSARYRRVSKQCLRPEKERYTYRWIRRVFVFRMMMRRDCC